MHKSMPNKSSYKFSMMLSLAFHLLILAVLLIHFATSAHQPLAQPDTNIIKAVAVNPNHVQSQMDRIKMEQQRQQQVAQELEKQQKELQMAEQKALAAKQHQEQVQKQKQEQAQLAAQKIEQEKILQEKVQQEIQQEKEKQKQEKVKQEKLKQQQKQKQLAQELKLQQQKELKNQIEQEQRQLAEVSAKQNQSEIDKYRALIVQAIQQNWIIPDENINKELSCELLIQVGPGGSVLSVQVTHSSGNVGLDNSARTAVLRSSPLPVPADPALFDQFRQLRLRVKPENIVSG